MVLGDPGVWANQFRSLDTRLLECIISIWPDCLAVLPPTYAWRIVSICRNFVDFIVLLIREIYLR